MKFMLNITIITFIFIGFFLCSYENKFSEFLYKTSFYSENIKEHIEKIILQNKNVNNSNKNPDKMNEYFLTFLNSSNLNHKILSSSDFSIINLNQMEKSINSKNVLFMDNEESQTSLNENLFRFFNYKDFSIAYLKPKLSNNKEMVFLYRYLKILKSNSYIPIVIIEKENLDEKLLKYFFKETAIFIVLDKDFSITPINNLYVIHINLNEDNNLLYKLDINILNSSLNKFRFKLIPINKESFDPTFFKNNYKFNCELDDNKHVDCIFLDFYIKN